MFAHRVCNFARDTRGRGKMTFVDSESCYDGEFFDDFYQGQGKWILPDGVVFEGLFERNCLVNGVIWEYFLFLQKCLSRVSSSSSFSKLLFVLSRQNNIPR